jgi:hypothetical protein
MGEGSPTPHQPAEPKQGKLRQFIHKWHPRAGATSSLLVEAQPAENNDTPEQIEQSPRELLAERLKALTLLSMDAKKGDKTLTKRLPVSLRMRDYDLREGIIPSNPNTERLIQTLLSSEKYPLLSEAVVLPEALEDKVAFFTPENIHQIRTADFVLGVAGLVGRMDERFVTQFNNLVRTDSLPGCLTSEEEDERYWEAIWIQRSGGYHAKPPTEQNKFTTLCREQLGEKLGPDQLKPVQNLDAIVLTLNTDYPRE